MFNKLSIQTGILIFLMIAVTLSAGFWYQYHDSTAKLPATFEHEAITDTMLIATGINQNVRYQRSFQIWNQMKQIQQRFTSNASMMITSFTVLNAEQLVLTDSDPESHPVMTHMKLPPLGVSRHDYNIQVVQAIYHPADGSVIGHIIINFYAEGIPHELKKIQIQTLSSLIIGLLLSILLAVGMSYRVSTPLRQLSKLATRIGLGNIDITPFSKKPREIKSLATSIKQADQTIRQKTDELENHQALLQSILNHSPAIICIKDSDGRYTLANERYEKVFQLKAVDIIGKTDADIFEPKVAEKLREHDLEVISNHKILTTEETLFNQDGAHEFLSLKFPLFDHNGKFESICCIATDITEQKKTHANMLKLTSAIDQADELVVLTDKNGVIDYVNKAFERVSGYSASEAIGKTPNIVKSGEHSKAYYDSMWKALNAGEIWYGDFINKKKDGERYEVNQSITPIKNERGHIIGFASVQRDVTHLRQVQHKLQHMDRVESLGVLAGGIAHDFNNLLTAILGNASLAASKLDEHSPALRYMHAIEVASHSAADLCRQMLAYSGKGKFVVEEVNLSELVEDMCTLIDVSIEKNVVLKYQLAEQIPAIKADVAQIKQIILNLITNASEAIDKKSGVISVTTGVMQVDSEYLNGCISAKTLKEGRYVFLEVSDTGSGMSKETQKKIFDPFFTTKFTGRGLGMSAMLGIVQGHHAGLRIYSEEGKGSTIKIAFPIAGELADNMANTEVVPTWKGSGTVLVVDDEETLREVASFMLEDIGFTVITANDGMEAVSIYREYQNQIKLVLLDMTMPKMDGAGCFRELRNINPEVCVLLSSGYNEQDATTRFSGKGLAGFIQKPYSANDLRRKLEEILS